MGDEETGGASLPYRLYEGEFARREGAGQKLIDERRRRRRGRGGVFLATTAAVVVVAMVVVVLVLVLAGGSDTELRAGGAPIANASAALEEAETRVDLMLREAEALGLDASTDDRAGCWYSYPGGPDGDGEPNEFLRCGPVAFADSEPGTHWLEVPISFRADGDSTRVVIRNATSRRTHSLVSDEELRRPNGAAPPAPDTIDLERPPATATEPGLAGAMEPDDVMVDLEQPDDGRVNGVAHSSEVVALGTADRVRLTDEPLTGEGTVFEAAEGERWLVFQLAADRDLGSLERIDYRVAVGGGESRPLRDVSQPWDTGVVDQQLFAVSVPDDAQDVRLVVDDEVVEQSWSFATRERTDDAIAVLYRDEGSRSAAVDQEFTLPYAAQDLNPIPGVPAFGDLPAIPGIDNSRAFGDVELSLEIGRARLSYAVEMLEISTDITSDMRTVTASGPNRALLFLEGVNARWGAVEHEDFALTPENAVLTLDDGRQIEAIHIGNEVAESEPGGSDALGLALPLFRGIPVWDVPADIESATVTIRPGTGKAFSGLFNLDFRDGVIQFELEFGDPSSADESDDADEPTGNADESDDADERQAQQHPASQGRNADLR